MGREFLTPAEAALYLNTTRNTIYRWVRAGTLPAIKVGGVWRISKATLEATGSSSAALGYGDHAGSIPYVGWSEVLGRVTRVESSHWLVITSTPDEVYDVDASFLSRGLAAGHRVVKGSWWQSEEDVRHELAVRGIDVEAAERSGALVLLDVAACYRRSGVPGVVAKWGELLDGARRLGLRGLWKSGSPVLDDRALFDGVAQVEEAAARFFNRPGAHAICPVFSASNHPEWHTRFMRILGSHKVAVYRSGDHAVVLQPAPDRQGPWS